MEYELVGPLSFEQIVKMESEGARFSDLSQTIRILRETVDNISAISSPLQKEILYSKVGNIITSTPVRSVPEKGIYLGDNLVPFGFREFYRERCKKEIFSHPMLKLGMPGKTLEDFWRLLWDGKMELCLTGGKDSGLEWESRALFDIDYGDNFLELYFDRIMNEPPRVGNYNYHGFLVGTGKT